MYIKEDNPHLEGTREEFIMNNMKLAYSIAQRYRVYANRNGVENEDLYSIAMLGLVKAYNNFNPTTVGTGEIAFSTFAHPYIKGTILVGIRDNQQSGIRVGRRVKELAIFILKKDKDYQTVSEIQEDFPDYSERMITEAFVYVKNGTVADSMERKLVNEEGGEGVLVQDILGLEQDKTSIEVESFIKTLPERDQLILRCRLKGMTNVSIAEVIGVSRARVGVLFDNIKERIEAYRFEGYSNDVLIMKDPFSKSRNQKLRKQLAEDIKKQEKRKAEAETLQSRTRRNMKARGLETLINALENTDCSYVEIVTNTGYSYDQVAYYGKRLRSATKRKQLKLAHLENLRSRV